MILVSYLFFVFACGTSESEPVQQLDHTVITISDNVITQNIQRMGINLGYDLWYCGAALTKERIPHGGFEAQAF